jgi:hypothetical protein
MSLRRNVRLRREYLYRKSLEGKEKAAYERRRLVRSALAGTVDASPCFARFLMRSPPPPSSRGQGHPNGAEGSGAGVAA